MKKKFANKKISCYICSVEIKNRYDKKKKKSFEIYKKVVIFVM